MIASGPDISLVNAIAAPLLCDKCKTCERADDDEERESSKAPKFELMFCADCMSLNNTKPAHDIFDNIPRRKRNANRRHQLPPSNSVNHDQASTSIELASLNNSVQILSGKAQEKLESQRLASEHEEQVQLRISNLSTKSQVILLESFLSPSNGVSSVRTFLNDDDKRKAKLVDITYDPIRISLSSLISSLVELGLDASILKVDSKGSNDGRKDEEEPQIPCRSSLHVEGICCTTEVPIVTSILRGAGVEKVNINVTSRMVYIDHFPEKQLASELATLLTNEGFKSTIKKDGGISKRKKKRRKSTGTQDTANSSVETSLFDNDDEKSKNVISTRYWHDILPKGLSMNIILSGIFWIISLVGAFNVDL